MRKLLLAWILVVAGCTTLPPHPALVNLKTPAALSKVVLAEPVEKRFAQGPMALQGLTSGTYVSAHENEHGTFYVGPGRPVFERLVESKQYQMFKGGFWLPHDKEAKPRLYFYMLAQSELRDTPEPTKEEVQEDTTVAMLAMGGTAAPGASILTQGVGVGIASGLATYLASREGPYIAMYGIVDDPEQQARLRAVVPVGATASPR